MPNVQHKKIKVLQAYAKGTTESNLIEYFLLQYMIQSPNE